MRIDNFDSDNYKNIVTVKGFMSDVLMRGRGHVTEVLKAFQFPVLRHRQIWAGLKPGADCIFPLYQGILEYLSGYNWNTDAVGQTLYCQMVSIPSGIAGSVIVEVDNSLFGSPYPANETHWSPWYDGVNSPYNFCQLLLPAGSIITGTAPQLAQIKLVGSPRKYVIFPVADQDGDNFMIAYFNAEARYIVDGRFYSQYTNEQPIAGDLYGYLLNGESPPFFIRLMDRDNGVVASGEFAVDGFYYDVADTETYEFLQRDTELVLHGRAYKLDPPGTVASGIIEFNVL